jgi:hypothetical protein
MSADLVGHVELRDAKGERSRPAQSCLKAW